MLRPVAYATGDTLYRMDIAIGSGFHDVDRSISIPLSGISLLCDFVALLTTGFLATTA